MNIVIYKQKRKLELYEGEKLLNTYNVALGFSPTGGKEIEGDGKTPEGEFFVFTKNPESKFHLSLGISYPSIDAAERGLKNSLISRTEYDDIVVAIADKKMPPQHTPLGGEIYIHGGGSESDWTDGCIALKNEEMRQLFEIVEIGTPVRII